MILRENEGNPNFSIIWKLEMIQQKVFEKERMKLRTKVLKSEEDILQSTGRENT